MSGQPEKKNEVQSGPAEYVFEYTTLGGLTVGDRLQEYQSTLRVDRNDLTVTLEIYRSPMDEPGAPIGLFRHQASAKDLDALGDVIEKADLKNLPEPSGGGPGVNEMTFQYELKDVFINCTRATRDQKALAQLEQLLEELRKLTRTMLTKPACAIALEVRYVEGTAADRFELVVKNIGTEAVIMSDPRVIQINGERWCGVQTAPYPPEKPGFTAPPLKWTRLALLPPVKSASDDPHVLIEAGKEFVAPSEPWMPRVRGERYLVESVYSNYVGPAVFEEKYRIRGHVISPAIEVTPARRP